MFNSFSFTFSMNNRAGHRLACAGSPERLACCWRQNGETSRLQCHWKHASAGEILPADVERETQVVGHDGCHSVQCFIGSNGTLNSPDLNRAGCSMTALPASLN